ncbi:MAG: FecR domain-containing protein [Verrucomicrobiota bacterium]
MISFFKLLGMAAIALLPLMSFGALQMGNVQVGKVSGSVSLIDAKSQRKPLAAGALFQEGSRVETGTDSTAELVFSNGATLLLTPGTLLELKTFRQVPSASIVDPYRQILADPSPSVTEVELSRGKVIGEVRKLNALSTFTVKTPVGMTRIRGTVFTVAYEILANGLGKHVSTCLRGSIVSSVFDKAGLVTIKPGWTFMSVNVPTLGVFQKPLILNDEQQTFLYITPSEEITWISLFIKEFSTLEEEVSWTIGLMAPVAPFLTQVFPNDLARPVPPFAYDITNGNVPTDETQIAKFSAPEAPMNLSNGGGGTTYDESLKKIFDNANRSVEMKQLNPTPTGG